MPGGLPGVWRRQDQGRLKTGKDRQWDRVSELWFDSYSSWRSFLAGLGGVCPPPWAERDGYPFLTLGDSFISTFLVEQPNNDFLAERRVYL